jgi:hypothetical protein
MRREPMFPVLRKVAGVVAGWVVCVAVLRVLGRFTLWGSFRVATSVDQALLFGVWMAAWMGPLAAALGGLAAGAISNGRGWRYGLSVGVVAALATLGLSWMPAMGVSCLWSAPYPLLAVAASLVLGALAGDMGRTLVCRDWPGTVRRARFLVPLFLGIPLTIFWLVRGHPEETAAAVGDLPRTVPQVRLLKTTSSLMAMDGEIVAVDLASGKMQTLATLNGTAVETGSLSPDGSKLAYVDSAGMGHLVIQDVTTARAIAMTDFLECSNPTWSPDSAWVAFECHTIELAGIYIVRADGSGDSIRVASFRLPYNLHHRLQWSPDAKRLYVERNEKNGRHAALCEIDLQRGTETVVTDDCMGDSWVTDGKMLLFQRESPSGKTVWLRRRIGSPQEQKAEEQHAYGYSVSPDGSRIVGWTDTMPAFIGLLGDTRQAPLPVARSSIAEIV